MGMIGDLYCDGIIEGQDLMFEFIDAWMNNPEHQCYIGSMGKEILRDDLKEFMKEAM